MENSEAVDILLVEDNPNDMELMLRALKRRNICNALHTVQDGAAALDFIFCREQYSGRSFIKPPRVVLLDLKLPKVGGLEVLKAVKADPRTSSIPVVIVTSSQEDPDIKTAYALGANSYVVKVTS